MNDKLTIEIPKELLISVKTDNNCIRIWRFNNAPKKLQNLSDHGGDEDWLAFIPQAIWEANYYIGWLEEGTSFGCCSVSTHQVFNGVVRIGAHA